MINDNINIFDNTILLILIYLKLITAVINFVVFFTNCTF